jgi:hypothetical protein
LAGGLMTVLATGYVDDLRGSVESAAFSEEHFLFRAPGKCANDDSAAPCVVRELSAACFTAEC